MINVHPVYIEELTNASIDYFNLITDRSTLVQPDAHPNLIIRQYNVVESDLIRNFIILVLTYVVLRLISYYILYRKSR